MKDDKKKVLKGLFCIIIVLFIVILISFKNGYLNATFTKAEAFIEEIKEKIFLVENTEKEIIPENKYYYQLLDNKGKEHYEKLVYGIRNMENSVYLSGANIGLINKVFLYVEYDYPEFFWIDSGNLITNGIGPLGYTIFEMDYSCSITEKEVKQKEIDTVVSGYLNGISQEASDYEKICYVYETLIRDVGYQLDAKDNQNICSVFLHKASVCAGYAKATQYLLERLGVFATYVIGSVESDRHAWNLVKCENEYYYVDTTWGDPLFTDSVQTNTINNINYDYLCCNDAEIFKTHELEGSVTFPKCNSMSCNYYVVNGSYYDSFDKNRIYNSIVSDVNSRKTHTVLKFAKQKDYEKSKEILFSDYIPKIWTDYCQKHGLGSYQYTYQDEESLRKITLYWNY